MGLLGVIIAAAFGGGGGLVALILRFRPERDNITVEAAQKAVALMGEAMEDLGAELQKARAAVMQLQDRLDNALMITQRLETALEQERAKVFRLEQRIAELSRRQDDAEDH